MTVANQGLEFVGEAVERFEAKAAAAVGGGGELDPLLEMSLHHL
jgi:hypothetical protein